MKNKHFGFTKCDVKFSKKNTYISAECYINNF